MTAVVALGINGIIGQGIFLTPGMAAEKLGPASIVGIVLGGALSFLIALCFAEVGSRFQATGGGYLYARKAFGPFVGFEVGWMTCCVAVIAWAALASGFTKVLAYFFPLVQEGWVQPAVAILLMSFLTLVNLRGAKVGAAVSTFFSVAKLIPIVLFVGVGIFHIEPANFQPFAPEGYGSLAETTLILLYAYVGFETLVVPAGEMQNPKKSVPLAMLLVMTIVSVVYISVLSVAVGTFEDLAGHPNPIAAASAQIMGPWGGTLVAVGVCISVFGTNAGAALVSPRRFYALAEQGDLPKILATTDPKTGAPVPAILLTLVLAAALTLTGTFKELAILSVVARFMQYIPTCLAALVFRAQDSSDAEPSGFRLPGGALFPVGTVFLCLWLLAVSDPHRLLMGGTALLIGAVVYAIKKRLSPEPASRAVQTESAAGPTNIGNRVMMVILAGVVLGWGVTLLSN